MIPDFTQENRNKIDSFFKHSQENPWGNLIAIKCTASALIEWRNNGKIKKLINESVSKPDWGNENSRDYASSVTSDPRFFLFNVNELYNSINDIGVRIPVHIHRVATDNKFSDLHPINNKIETLCEFFPNKMITCIYHDYDYLREYWPDKLNDWYKQWEYTIIDNTDDYLKLFGADRDSNETRFGWDLCKNIIQSPNNVWDFLKVSAQDWQYIDITKHYGDPLLENAPFLTMTDRFHRNAMYENEIALGDILIKTSDGFVFCDKEFKNVDQDDHDERWY
jgi:hypothetical protein